jgi:copper chaperone NosL
MRLMIDRLYDYLGQPLILKSRVVLLALIIPLALAFTAPLWRISMTAPQYPKGLSMDVFAYKLVGGGNGQHITEINTLNHYIGMRKLDATSFADLDWIPFALGLLGILALRTALIGRVRDLIDLVVMTAYVSVFAFGRFVYQLWVFGHDLDPHAPVKVAPFMPVVLGHKTVANFETYSMPAAGSYYLATFVVGSMLVLAWHLWTGRRQAVRDAARGPAPTSREVAP